MRGRLRPAHEDIFADIFGAIFSIANFKYNYFTYTELASEVSAVFSFSRHCFIFSFQIRKYLIRLRSI